MLVCDEGTRRGECGMDMRLWAEGCGFVVRTPPTMDDAMECLVWIGRALADWG